MRILLTVLFFCSTMFPLRVVSETNFSKIINGDSGIEFLLKSTIPMQGFDIKVGVSEAYTAPRTSMLSMNHALTRFDIGCYWNLFDNWEIGYTHSARSWFEGANPKSVYMGDSVDTLSIRKEFEL